MTNEEYETWVRFWLADLTESELSSVNMQLLIEMTETQYPDADTCEMKYRILINVLNYLIREGSKGSSGTTGSGEISRRKEVRGSTTVEVEWSVGSSGGTSTSWDTILENLLADPSSIGCDPIGSSTSTSTGSVIIGGTGKDRFDTSTPWRENLLSPKRKSWTCIR